MIEGMTRLSGQGKRMLSREPQRKKLQEENQQPLLLQGGLEDELGKCTWSLGS